MSQDRRLLAVRCCKMFRFVQFLPNQFVRETKDKGSEVLELRNWEACDISRVWGWILFGFLMFLTVLWPNGQPTERIIGLSRLALAGQNVICGFLGQSSCQESYEYAKTAATTSSRAEIQVTLAWYNQRVAYRISFIAYRHNSHSTLRKVQGIPRMRKHFWVSGTTLLSSRQKCHTGNMQRHRCREPFEMHLMDRRHRGIEGISTSAADPTCKGDNHEPKQPATATVPHLSDLQHQ